MAIIKLYGEIIPELMISQMKTYPLLNVRHPEHKMPEESYFGDCPCCNPGGGGQLWKMRVRTEIGAIAIGLWCDECDAWADVGSDGVWQLPETCAGLHAKAELLGSTYGKLAMEFILEL
jgi:hypothetical protein